MTRELLVLRLAELVVAPAALALAALHLMKMRGWRRAAVELVALGLYGFAAERVGVAHFDRYAYGQGFLLAPLGVPVAVACAWCAVLIAVEALAAAALPGASALLVAALATGLGLALDAGMEGVARRALLWSFTPPGDVFGAPLGNFVGWICIVFPWVALRRRGLPSWSAGLAGVATVIGVGEAWMAFSLDYRLGPWGEALLVALVVVALALALWLRLSADAAGRTPGVALALAAYAGLGASFAVFALLLRAPVPFLVASLAPLLGAWVAAGLPLPRAAGGAGPGLLTDWEPADTL